MKIGILTYHRTNNYGALMQAVATRVYLQQQGHEVYYIDYWPQYHKESYEVFSWNRWMRRPFKQKVKELLYYFQTKEGKQKRIDAFTPFIEEFIVPYCKPYDASEHYDVAIYGSDQIWRKQKGLNNQLNWVYFGKNQINAEKHISYAASMGEIQLTDSDRNGIKDNLSKFSKLGVRENNIYDLLNDLHLPNVIKNIDPTLLLSAEEWDKIIKPKRLVEEPYAVLYQIVPSFNKREIERVCKQKNLKLVTIPANYSIRERNNQFAVADPYQFISLIKYADFSFVSSFHGLVFSINYGIPFFTSFVKAPDRAETILKALELEDRMISPFQQLPSNDIVIDYEQVHNKLGLYIVSSQEFLSLL